MRTADLLQTLPMSPRRFRVPAGDGEIFAEPSLDSISHLLNSIGKSNFEAPPFPGLNFQEFRKRARREVLDLVGNSADSHVWFVAGHEPEFSHPGVWLKNSALTRLAKKCHGVGL